MTSTVVTTPLARQTKRYGWLPDLPDNRDHIWKPGRKAPRKLPSKVDLRTSGFEPPIYDQGYLGSCTANAIAGAYEFEQRRQGLTDFTPARLFIYFEERRKINTLSVDSGAFIRDGLDVVHKLGAPNEALWPYDINRFTLQPTQEVYADGEKHQTIAYASVDNRREYMVKTALAMGIPVVFGFTVYSWFENPDAHGVVTPAAGASVLGGHAVEIVGYETIKRRPYGIVRNSWGPSWSDHGYCYMPLNFICTADCDDFWAIQAVES